MRVLFDAYWWVHGPSANRTVLREFVLQWRRRFPEDDLVLAVPHDQEVLDAQELEIVRTRLRPHALSNAIELPRLGRRTGADVLVAHNYTPLSRLSVTFIHDLLFEVEPSWFSFAERLYFWPMSRLAVRAAAVATSSRTEAARMERLHPGLSPVHPIGLAVATELRGAVPSRPASASGLESFALSVGRLNARKNLVTAVLGAHASGRLSPSSPLLVVGSAEHSGVGTALPPAIERLVAARSVVFLGRVSDGELRWLYEHAAVTIYCSLDEGFGLPPIEASAFGSPLVVSDRPIFHETVGGHAVFADPLDPASIAAAVDTTWGTRGSARGGHSSVEYSWVETVDRLRELCVTAATRL